MEQSDGVKGFMDATEGAASFMLILLIAGVVFMLCGAGESRYMVIFVRQLQIILNLPLYKVSFPPNFITFVAMAIMIALFDVLEFFLDWDDVNFLQFQDVDLTVEDQANNVGYESHDMLRNLNTVGIILLLVAI